MTVYQYYVIAVIAVALCLAILSGVFFVPRNELHKLEKQHWELMTRYRDTINFCYDEICNHELLRHKVLPLPTQAIYGRVSDAYEDPELKLYKLPLGWIPGSVNEITGDVKPVVYFWKSLAYELSACELAQLWMRGIIQ